MRIIHSTSNSPTFNLAAEEYFFSERTEDLLFLYVNEPSVIIGCNQAIQNEVDLEFCAQNEVRIVRRMSGGGAVFHDFGNLNFCFISNKTEGKSALNDEFLKPVVSVLKELGVLVEIGKRKDLWLQKEYKITGTASHIAKNRELHHGTLLYDTNLEMLEKALSPESKDTNVKAIASVRSTVKNLRTWFAEQEQFFLEAGEFFDFLIRKIQQYYQQESVESLSDEHVSQINLLAETKYCSAEWTYKK
ncbi:MAG: biotin/lipoate A/B protein ligase family protein [Paludibacter sp.]|jgi:lipoate---protein ligase